MNDTYYFSHDYNSRQDDKIQHLIFEMGYEGYGIYWSLVELLYQNGGYIEYDCKRIAFALQTEYEKIEQIINNFNLFFLHNNKLSCKSILHRLKKRNNISIKRQKAAKTRWSKGIQNNAKAMQLHSKSNAIKERKGKENKVNKYIYNNFYDNEIKKNKNEQFLDKYLLILKLIFGVIGVNNKLDSILKLQNQLTYNQFINLYAKCQEKNVKLSDLLIKMDNWKDLNKKNKGISSTAHNWLNRNNK